MKHHHSKTLATALIVVALTLAAAAACMGESVTASLRSDVGLEAGITSFLYP